MEKLTVEQQKRLKQYLKEKRITKYRIAHDLNLSASTISNYLNGKTKPDNIKWDLVRNYLGITDEWLLTGQNIVSTLQGKTSPENQPDSTDIEAKVEEIRLMFQTRDDQYKNLHKDLQKLARIQQELLNALTTFLAKQENKEG